MRGPAVYVKDLVRIYRTEAMRYRALKGVSLEVAAGRSLAITGPSGSGKSTLLRILAGLDRPTSGEVRVLGEDLGTMNEDERTMFRRNHVGFVFQDYGLLRLTAAENVAFPLVLRGLPRGKCTSRARSLLARLGLEAHADHLPSQLSGGQQQRIGIARALVADPQIVFADEPTGSLDSTAAADVMDLMLQLVREKNATVVFVTHDAARAAAADQIVELWDGSVRREGTV